MTIPHHISHEQTPFERGIAFGRAQKAAISNCLRSYRQMFAASRGLTRADILAAGNEYRRAITHDYPELASEIEGIALGSGKAADELFAVNARTEILAGSFKKECSVVGFGAADESADPWLAQNWDWHSDARASRVLWEVHLPSGLSFVTLTEAGILAKLGLNSAGLGVLLNLLATDADGGADGVPIHIALRLILGECQNVAEGRSLLESVHLSASSAVSLIDRSGALVTLEGWPKGTRAVDPSTAGFVTHTNHFCQPIEGARDVIVEDYPDTLARRSYLDEQLTRVESTPHYTLAAQLLQSHDGWPHSVCLHCGDNPAYLERQETLLSVILRPRDDTIMFTDGPPCRNEYRSVHLTSSTPEQVAPPH